MKKAIMLKTKRYKFGFVLAKDEEVLIEEAPKGHSDGFYAKKSNDEKDSPLRFGVKRTDFSYKDEPQMFRIDSDRVSQYEGERVVDTVTLVEEPKKGAKKVLVYSPKLQANVLVYRKDLKLI